MNDKYKKPPYCYGYAQRTYKKLKKYEVQTEIPVAKEDELLIVRVDGRGLTSRFKNANELFLPDFHLAMEQILKDIRAYCPFVKFAYSFKDEISFLVDKDFIKTNKNYKNRLEKVLPIISGYVSAIFSQSIPPNLKNTPTESFAFDARAILLPNDKLKQYFHARQAFAIASFMDRLCSFHKLAIKNRTFANVKKALKEKGMQWNDFPEYVWHGFVGFEKAKWEVKIAYDFSEAWENYFVSPGIPPKT